VDFWVCGRFSGDESVGANASVPVAKAGYGVFVVGKTAVTIVDHDEIVPGTVHFRKCKHVEKCSRGRGSELNGETLRRAQNARVKVCLQILWETLMGHECALWEVCRVAVNGCRFSLGSAFAKAMGGVAGTGVFERGC
jgi:hypothetical protein